MADDETAGQGPGEGYVTPRWIAIVALYLVALTFVCMAGLMVLWPSCETDVGRPANTFSVASITPSVGKVAGGESVTIEGTGLVDGANASFDGVPGVNPKFVNSTSLIVQTPPHTAGRADVVVTNGDKKAERLSGGFVYAEPGQLPKPSITSLSPVGGPVGGGQTVTINGSGFSSVTTVRFGGVRATDVRFVNETTLTAVTPGHAEGKVDVLVGDGSTATLANSYTYTCWGAVPYRLFLMVAFAGALGSALHGLRSLFWYVGNRDLRWSWLPMYWLLPVSGAAIATIFFLVAYAGLYTIQGTGSFLLIGLAALVGMFSPQAAEKLKKIAEGLFTNAPPGANTVPAASALKITAIDSTFGPAAGKQAVKIKGTGLSGVTTVTFGGLKADGVKAGSATEVEAITPAHAAGPVDVVVGDGKTSSTLTNGYTYA